MTAQCLSDLHCLRAIKEASNRKTFRHALTSAAVGLTIGAGCAPVAAQTYLEALGASIDLQAIGEVGQVSSAVRLAQAPAAASAPARLEHDGGIVRQSNVPAPGATQVTAPTPAPATAPAQAVQNVSSTAPGAALGQGNSTQAMALPDPRITPAIDIPQEVLNQLAPANTEQLRQILKELNERQGAAVTPVRPELTSKASQYVVDLSPGATPPVIRVASGVGATVNFVDAGGNPWPITFANNFNAEAATITQMAPHVLSVAANSPHLTGSVGVMLQGLTTPVNFMITPAQQTTDYRVDLLIPGMSPDSPPMVGAMQSRPAIGGQDLKDYLYGATPEGAIRLKVGGDAAKASLTRAWQDTKGNLVLRTSARVVSPGWYHMLPALDGTSVYQLAPTPVVRVSVDGQLQTFSIEGLVPKSDLAKR